MPNRWRLNMLGSCELWAPGNVQVRVTSRKALAMLGFLAAQPDKRASRERLGALLWENADGSQARLNLRKALSSLRQEAKAVTPEPLPIATEGDLIQLDGSRLATDVERLESSVAEAGFAQADDFHAIAELYRGHFLEELSLRDAAEFENWAQLERQRLRDVAIRGFSAIMDATNGAASDQQVAAAIRLLSIDPLQERAHRALMRLYARQGRPGAAMKQFNNLSALLQRELQTSPEVETQELFRTISRSRRSGAAPPEDERSRARPRRDLEPDCAPDTAEAALSLGRQRLKRRKSRLMILVAAAAMVAPIVYSQLPFLLRASLTPAAFRDERPEAVAVLPFVGLDGSKEGTVFADGLTEEIINSLAHFSDLRVTGRNSSFYFKGTDADFREIGRRLGVRYLVTGSVRLSEGRLRATARLIDSWTGAAMWSNDYSTAVGDAFTVQNSIAEGVASALRAHLVPLRERTSFRSSRANYQLYLAALSHLQSQEADRVRTAASLLERLRNMEPDNVAAHARYAEAMVFLGRNNLVSFEEALGRSMDAVQKALRIDPGSADAHLAKGMLYNYIAYNYGTEEHGRRAEAELARAVQLAPTPQALTAYGMQLALSERYEQAIANLRRAVELDPLDLKAQYELGRALEYSGQPVEALRQYGTLDELYPKLSQAKTAAGRLLVRYGQLARGEPWLVQARSLDENFAPTLWLLALYANLHMEKEVDQVLRSMRTPPADRIAAVVRLRLAGRHSEAIRLIGRELAKGWDPLWATGALTAAVMEHRHDEAMQYLKRLAPDMLSPTPRIAPDAVDIAFMAAHVLRETGNDAQADRILETLLATTLRPGRSGDPSWHVWRSGAYAEMGDAGRALAEFELAPAAGWRTLIDVNNFLRIDDYPMFEKLRTHPRFRAVIARVEQRNAEQRAILLARRGTAS